MVSFSDTRGSASFSPWMVIPLRVLVSELGECRGKKIYFAVGNILLGLPT